MGAFVNRFGCRVAIIVGCLSCAVGLALGSLASNMLVLCLAFSVPFGLGISFVYVSGPVAVTQYFNKRRSIALGLVTAGQGLGTMILGPMLQALVNVFYWRNTMLIMAGVLAITSLTGCFLKGSDQDFTTSSPQGTKKSKKFSWNFSVWKSPAFLVLLVMAGIVNFFRMIPYVHLMKYCDDLGIPADRSSTLFLFLGLFAAIGRLSAGFLCDIRCINSQFLYQASVFISGASTMLLVLAKTYSSLAAVVVFFSAADGMMVSTFIIELFKSVKESQRASCLGFCMMVAGFFVFCGPPLSGLMADKLGSYVPAFLMAGGVGVIGSLIPFTLLCIKQKSNSDQDRLRYLEELMDKEQDGMTKKENKTDNFLKTTSFVQLECSNPVIVRTTTAHRQTHKRPVSFMWAMESPLNVLPS